MEIKARAEVVFFDDPHEKPMVTLMGQWRARDAEKAGFLILKQLHIYRRQIQKGEVKQEDTPLAVEAETPSAPSEVEESHEEVGSDAERSE